MTLNIIDTTLKENLITKDRPLKTFTCDCMKFYKGKIKDPKYQPKCCNLKIKSEIIPSENNNNIYFIKINKKLINRTLEWFSIANYLNKRFIISNLTIEEKLKYKKIKKTLEKDNYLKYHLTIYLLFLNDLKKVTLIEQLNYDNDHLQDDILHHIYEFFNNNLKITLDFNTDIIKDKIQSKYNPIGIFNDDITFNPFITFFHLSQSFMQCQKLNENTVILPFTKMNEKILLPFTKMNEKINKIILEIIKEYNLKLSFKI